MSLIVLGKERLDSTMGEKEEKFMYLLLMLDYWNALKNHHKNLVFGLDLPHALESQSP